MTPLSTEPNPTIFLIVGPHPTEVARPTWTPSRETGTGARWTSAGDLRRQAVPRVHRLDRRPIEVQPDEPPRRTARLAFREQRPLPGERRLLVERDEAAEADLERAST